MGVQQGRSGPIMSQPEITYSKGTSICRIKNYEWLRDINMTTTNGEFAVKAAMKINPGLLETFPYLSQQGRLWEEYTFKSLEFVLETNMPSTQGGAMIMAIDYDVLDGPPPSKSVMSNMGGCVKGVNFANLSMPVPMSNQAGLSTRKYTRTESVPAGADAKTYDIGQLFVATFGNQGQPGMPNSGTAELYASYVVEFHIPQLPSESSGSAGSLGSAHIIVAPDINNPQSLSTILGLSEDGEILNDGSSSSFCKNTVGKTCTGSLVAAKLFNSPATVPDRNATVFGPLPPGVYRLSLNTTIYNVSAQAGWPDTMPWPEASAPLYIIPTLVESDMNTVASTGGVVQNNYTYSASANGDRDEFDFTNQPFTFSRHSWGFHALFTVAVPALATAAGWFVRFKLNNLISTAITGVILREYEMFCEATGMVEDIPPTIHSSLLSAPPELGYDREIDVDTYVVPAYQNGEAPCPLITSGGDSVKGTFRADQYDSTTNYVKCHGTGHYRLRVDVVSNAVDMREATCGYDSSSTVTNIVMSSQPKQGLIGSWTCWFDFDATAAEQQLNYRTLIEHNSSHGGPVAFQPVMTLTLVRNP